MRRRNSQSSRFPLSVKHTLHAGVRRKTAQWDTSGVVDAAGHFASVMVNVRLGDNLADSRASVLPSCQELS